MALMLKSLNRLYKDRVSRIDKFGKFGKFEEEKHPRDASGKWATGGEGGAGGTAESSSTESSGIPKFKNTNEAFAYGEKFADDPGKLKALQVERERLLAETAKIREGGEEVTMADLQRGMDIATKAQFMREALEAANRKAQTRR
jgi:hypothetical protein